MAGFGSRQLGPGVYTSILACSAILLGIVGARHGIRWCFRQNGRVGLGIVEPIQLGFPGAGPDITEYMGPHMVLHLVLRHQVRHVWEHMSCAPPASKGAGLKGAGFVERHQASARMVLPEPNLGLCSVR